MKKSILTVGADPELFIINTTTNKVVSAVNLIPGVKGHPWRDPMWVKGYGLEIDNILAEFNIPPAENCDEFVSRMLFMREYIRQFVKKINPELDIMCKASTHVSDEELNSEVAKLFGCSVDYNAYTEGPNPKPQGETTDLRSTGLHVHLGYPNKSADNSIMLVKYMDAYLGIPSVLIDQDKERRTLYGKAGCYRLTPYGVEYRTLSGYFLSSSGLIRFTYKSTVNAYNAFLQQKELPNSEDVIFAINNAETDLATQIMKDYNIPFEICVD